VALIASERQIVVGGDLAFAGDKSSWAGQMALPLHFVG
jgi:hypothetical protein